MMGTCFIRGEPVAHCFTGGDPTVIRTPAINLNAADGDCFSSAMTDAWAERGCWLL